MSALKARLTEAMKDAMRAKEAARLGVIRMALAALKQIEVDERVELDDARVLAVLAVHGVGGLHRQQAGAVLAAQRHARAAVLRAAGGVAPQPSDGAGPPSVVGGVAAVVVGDAPFRASSRSPSPCSPSWSPPGAS